MIVAIEGPNGVGKTSLMEAYAKLNPDVLCQLCVPGIYMNNHDVKAYMLFEASALGSAFYFLSGLIEGKVLNEKSQYSKILIDRSIWSTFAAAYSKDETSIIPLFKVLEEIQSYIHLPDKTFVLHASYETCTKRIGKKLAGNNFDKDDIIQFNKKISFYNLLKQRGNDITFIDTDNKTKEEVLISFSNLLVW